MFVCLIPVSLMLLGGSDSFYKIRQRSIRVQPSGTGQASQRRKDRLQRQMLLMLISSVIIFFATTLPVNLRVIVAAYQIDNHYPVDLTNVANQTAILTVFLSFNYAVSHLFSSLALKKRTASLKIYVTATSRLYEIKWVLLSSNSMLMHSRTFPPYAICDKTCPWLVGNKGDLWRWIVDSNFCLKLIRICLLCTYNIWSYSWLNQL